MTTQRAQLMRTQAVQAILTALGAASVFGDSTMGPDHAPGVMLASSDQFESEIWSETYWHELQPGSEAKRYRYRVVTTVRVERQELTSR